jgi:hypothetical protein
MKRAFAIAVATVLAVGLAGCGGGGSSSTSPTSSSGSALLLVRQTSVGLVGLSSSPDHLLRLELPLEFSNGTNVGCNLNYGRLQIFAPGDVEIERSEVTADDIVAQAGTNLVAQGSPLQATLIFNFNSLDFERVALTVGATDHNGHTVDRQINSLEVDPAPELLE